MVIRETERPGSKRLPWGTVLAAAVAGAAGVVVGSLLAEGPRTASAARAPSSNEPLERHARLERLSRLEADVARLEAELKEIARREAAIATGRASVAPAATAAREAPEDPRALEDLEDEKLEALRARALDGTRSPRERVLATRALWDLDLRTGMTGARTSQVVDALVALLATEPDAELRRQICFSVLAATGPEHVGVFLSTLEHDPDPGVRAQAADTLQHHLSDPAVRTALERASRADASEEVRATAREMLDRWDPERD